MDVLPLHEKEQIRPVHGSASALRGAGHAVVGGFEGTLNARFAGSRLARTNR